MSNGSGIGIEHARRDAGQVWGDVPMRQLFAAAKVLVVSFGAAALALPATAHDLFSPAVTINDSAVTFWELEQRIKMLEVFNQAGDIPEIAMEQLIEDRLKGEQLDRAGLALTDEGLEAAMTEFAARANLSLDEFLQVLGQNGVEFETLRDYVAMGISWRDFIRGRYRDRVNITENDITQFISEQGDDVTAIEVLLSEIIIPAPPPEAASAMATAERISRLTSTSAFSAEARRVSALPSRTNGGRLDWVPITNFPPALQPVFLGLEPGEVTAPISIPNGVALFQMRDVREVSIEPDPPVAIDYAAYYLAGGRTAGTLAEAAALEARVDTCDDLYGEALGQPESVLDRGALSPAEIPQDVALELAKLDPGEVSTALTRSNGQTLVFLMLCARHPIPSDEIDRDAIRQQLVSQQLAGYADSLVADLKASASIVRH